ncbi:MAG: nicotinate (nicotinamide) nucleotide adenylyltransferase [Deltaproteobacteria bacterium]|nr:nicotinate (nicotinamide) nucleotide adenylyltransferase [Deltaproteobacteria bacterium]
MISNPIGILGGSFDPVHNGHVELAREVQRRCGFKPLWIVPTKQPPHKPPYEISDPHRLEMVRLAFDGVPEARISNFEMESDGPSYAIRTIEYFTRQHPGSSIHFILGEDAFHDLPKWHAFPDVLEACSYVVASRAGWDQQPTASTLSKLSRRLEQLTKAGLLRVLEDADPAPFARVFATRTGTRVCVLEARLPEISSTAIRVRLQLGENVTDLVPSAVERYLKTNNLYGTKNS